MNITEDMKFRRIPIIFVPEPVRQGDTTFEEIKLTRGNLYNTQKVYYDNIKHRQREFITTLYFDKIPTDAMIENYCFICSREPIESWVGGSVEECERRDGFIIYKITPRASKMVFDHV